MEWGRGLWWSGAGAAAKKKEYFSAVEKYSFWVSKVFVLRAESIRFGRQKESFFVWLFFAFAFSVVLTVYFTISVALPSMRSPCLSGRNPLLEWGVRKLPSPALL